MVMTSAAGRREKRMNPAIQRFISGTQAESLTAEEILGWALENFHPRIALSCSFGAPEGMAVLDMMHRIEPTSRVFVLDTGRLPQATYDLMDRVRDRYDKSVEVIFPRAEDVESMVRKKGMNLFFESVEHRQLCCRIRKVEPLNRYLRDLDAWVTGLRRDQNVTRADTPKVEIDESHAGIVKINPIADWSSERILEYVGSRGIPINRLHSQGYPSVGCDPCSRAIAPDDDLRAGRWWWEDPETRECGIHTGDEEGGSGI